MENFNRIVIGGVFLLSSSELIAFAGKTTLDGYDQELLNSAQIHLIDQSKKQCSSLFYIGVNVCSSIDKHINAGCRRPAEVNQQKQKFGNAINIGSHWVQVSCKEVHNGMKRLLWKKDIFPSSAR